MEFTIREASIQNREQIIEFIKINWKEDHIFATNPAFFDYEFVMGDTINFILAEDNGKIVAILGYLQYNLTFEESHIFAVMWKSIHKSMAGMKCLQYLAHKKSKTISSCGINLKTKPPNL